MAKQERVNGEAVSIPAPNFKTVEFKLIGDAPLVMHRFPEKAGRQMREKMEQGSQAKKGVKRDARDFLADWEAAKHVSVDGWLGMPCAAFRAACISACRTVGFHMTQAKLGLFVEADGFEEIGGDPLVKVDGTLEPWESSIKPCRNATGVIDLRCRPMFRPGWTAKLRVRFDNDMFSLTDVANLITRVGMQVGIGEGRPDSKKSCGCNWGTFKVAEA